MDNRSKVAIACLICAIYPLYYGEIDGYLSRKISSGSAGEKAVAVIKVTELWSTAGLLNLVLNNVQSNYPIAHLSSFPTL